MGSSRTIDDEQKTYDAIYKIAYDALTTFGLTMRLKDTKVRKSDVPTEYVYLDQIHGGYEKRTLQHEVYDARVDFLCEINVSHGNISKGRRMSQLLQIAFYQQAPACGIVVKPALATDAVTPTGHKFVVSLDLTYTIKMV